MKKKYRILVFGDVPHDLKERIASIHASAILNSKNVDAAEHIQGSNNPNRAARCSREGTVEQYQD